MARPLRVEHHFWLYSNQVWTIWFADRTWAFDDLNDCQAEVRASLGRPYLRRTFGSIFEIFCWRTREKRQGTRPALRCCPASRFLCGLPAPCAIPNSPQHSSTWEASQLFGSVPSVFNQGQAEAKSDLLVLFPKPLGKYLATLSKHRDWDVERLWSQLFAENLQFSWSKRGFAPETAAMVGARAYGATRREPTPTKISANEGD